MYYFQQFIATKYSLENTSMSRDPATAERVLLDLLGTVDASIMQAYTDNDIRQNLAHHALASSLHLAMWLRKTGDVSRQRDEAIARVAELEERVRRFEKLFVKQEAENEILSLEVYEYCNMKEEYESKIKSLSNEVNQQKHVTVVLESKFKDMEAMHQEKATRLEKALKQLNDANMLLAEVSEGLGVAREPGARDPRHFWTVCIHCKVQYQYIRIYQNRRLRCPKCRNAFLAIETVSSPKSYPWSSPSWVKTEEDGQAAVKVEAQDAP
ncbi:hypothetical protein RchiOBHm_Chr6g0284061 [Rosa chinensis]|uniref:Zinc beta-ribbon domain-containing protein n=1 Tax=Rosa chinensis TaxID=74649 RepID=A0A2P6PU90_ROSCH|nr:hypothetical protein RchiOBHm_Chr6g0284061 [Rosa chinensis]